jgi:hypothetical protein
LRRSRRTPSTRAGSRTDTDGHDFYAAPPDEWGRANNALPQLRDDERALPPPLAPAQLVLDQSHLRPGVQATLLSHERTLELYRANAKKVRFALRTPPPVLTLSSPQMQEPDP